MRSKVILSLVEQEVCGITANRAEKETEYRYLIQQIANGDRNAFEKLYHHFVGPLAAYLKRRFHDEHLVYDMMQEIFVAIWKGASSYTGKAAPSAWVFGIARFKMMDMLREKYKRSEQLAASSEDMDEQVQLPAELDFSEQLSTSVAIRSVLEKLPMDTQELVSLVFEYGFSYKEIGQIMDIPEGTVKSRWFHIKKRLKKELAEWGAE